MAGYLDTLLSSLDDAGKQLVEVVLEKGKLVREVDVSFRTKAREIIANQLQQFQQQRNILAKNLQLFVDSINLESQHVDDIITSYINQIASMKQFVTESRKHIENMKEAPPGIELRQKCIDEFNTALDMLLSHASTVSVKVPWQIRQCAAADPTDQSAVVPLEGGRILDAEGRNIWGCDCYYCGEEIQDGSRGENDVRYHCIEVPFTDMCERCFTIRSTLIKKLEHSPSKESAMKLLEASDPHIHHQFVKESNIPVFMRFPVSEAKSLAIALHNACTVFQNRPCFGTINPSTKSIQYTAYHDIHQQSLKVAISLKHLLEQSLGLSDIFIGICSSNRPEWMLADFACTLNGYVSVGMHTQWPVDELKHIIDQAGIQCIVCDSTNLHKFQSIGHPLKCILVMDDVTNSNSDSLKIISWKHLMEKYCDSNISAGCGVSLGSGLVPTSSQADHPDRLFALIYSSGTTGEPKGIMVMEHNWRVDNVMQPNFMNPYVICSYSPLAHGMDRGMVWQAVMNGGQVVFCDANNLLRDVQIVEPVLFVAMPYFWNQIFANFQEELARSDEESLWKQYSTILGRRVKVVATGGAPISLEVLQFLTKCFPDCQVLNVYEAPGISTNGKIGPGVDVQLKSDEQYNVENGQQKDDNNRKVGEIIVKTPTMSPGYFKNPEKTQESFINGYFHTGDIGELDESGNLHVIDRKKNILEIYLDGRSVWIPSGVVESVLSKCSSVKQIFVHGERTQHGLIAVVVPQWAIVISLANQTLVEGTTEAKSWLNANIGKVEDAVMADMIRVGKDSGLKPFEIPQAVIVDFEPWTTQNGLLTATHKNARNKILSKYRLHIDLKYAQLNSQEH